MCPVVFLTSVLTPLYNDAYLTYRVTCMSHHITLGNKSPHFNGSKGISLPFLILLFLEIILLLPHALCLDAFEIIIAVS
jgi:hypothetical protein